MKIILDMDVERGSLTYWQVNEIAAGFRRLIYAAADVKLGEVGDPIYRDMKGMGIKPPEDWKDMTEGERVEWLDANHPLP